MLHIEVKLLRISEGRIRCANRGGTLAQQQVLKTRISLWRWDQSRGERTGQSIKRRYTPVDRSNKGVTKVVDRIKVRTRTKSDVVRQPEDAIPTPQYRLRGELVGEPDPRRELFARWVNIV